MQRHWVVVLLPSPTESKSSTSEAGYHVELERKSGSKPEGYHEKERAEPEQPVQAPEEPVSAVSSCGHVAPLEERFASWIGQQDPRFPSHEWLEDRAAPGATKCLSGRKCLCLEVRHEPQNVEQALRRVMQRNGLNMPEACLSIAIARLSTPRSCWDSVLQAARCQQLTSQRQLPAISFYCQTTPRTCQRCLSCWSRTAKNSV